MNLPPHLFALLVPLLWSAAVAAAPPPVKPLTSSDVGVYGTLFSFCDFSVYKFACSGTVDAKTAALWNRRLHEAAGRGKKNLVLVNTFDRIKHTRPLKEYVHNTDALLSALDLKTVYAICLAEENVPWNNGLQVLNGLYDHIHKRYSVPVYQWLSNPLPPHPSLRADGWIIDPYGLQRDRFRRYLQKYLVTGKPIIDCISASPYPGAPFDQSARDQVTICREFNVPMFFFCVDQRWGSPDLWLRSEAPDLTEARSWLLGVVSKLHREGAAGLPLLSANYSTGRPTEVAGDLEGNYAYEQDFATSAFLDDPTIRGFQGLRWNGADKTLTCIPVAAGIGRIELQYHFTSPFRIAQPRARLAGRLTAGAEVRFGISPNGHAWRNEKIQDTAGEFELDTGTLGPDPLPDREFWVRITVVSANASDAKAILSSLEVKCQTLPPPERVIRLKPDKNGHITFDEPFSSRKFLHFTDIEGAETLEWKRGSISTHGVAGRGNRVSVRWHFVMEHPVKNLVITAKGKANGPNLGAENTAGISIDGKDLLLRVSSGKQEKGRTGWSRGDLVLDTKNQPGLQKLREFYVHLILVNRSGVRTGTSNIVQTVQLRAESAAADSAKTPTPEPAKP